MAHSFASNLEKSSAAVRTSEATASSARWLSEVQLAHDRTGCTGTGRTYRDVRWSLKSLEKTTSASWPLELWYATSATAHQLMPHRLARVVDGVARWGGPSPSSERAFWLRVSTVVFGNIYLYAFGVLRPELLADYGLLHDQAIATVAALTDALPAA